ncbi:LAME_0E01794g1_1 [Lachancea meyersii CBS 8951]|uniref:LAME_0E01794g1_1 n=1 Tax=Lachancea meyersii CBS 8951 TaxID=1266667 RepID=A0A1G4JFC1_9SACH|nr:LAME_0E01794g1_1 [Lachancea meyersii CBS 8951]
MNSDLLERIETIRKSVEDFSSARRLHRPPLKARMIINKYKYKTKAPRTKKNRLLPEKFQKVGALYDRVCNVPTTQLRAPNFHNCLKSLVQNSRKLTTVEDKANLAVIAAAGWCTVPLKEIKDSQTLILKCSECSQVLYLKIDDYLNTVEFEHQAAELLAKAHHNHCSKHRGGFDIKRDYYLNHENLCLEFQRVIEELRSTSSWDLDAEVKLDCEKLAPIRSIFGVSDCSSSIGKLSLILKGYKFINSHVIECTGCYHSAFVKTFQDPQFNGHAKWCKYHNESKLVEMMHTPVNGTPGNQDIDQRLKALTEYFSAP